MKFTGKGEIFQKNFVSKVLLISEASGREEGKMNPAALLQSNYCV